jgi:DNA-directed RNA polymerase specialized sigma24 family protein
VAVTPGAVASTPGAEPFARGAMPITPGLTAIARVPRSASLAVAAPQKAHPNAARLGNPAVRRKILQVIGKQVSKADAEDVMQSTFVALLMMAPDLPEPQDELLALTTVVTKRRLLDFFRHRAVREGRDAKVEAIEEVNVSDGSISLETRADWQKMLVLVEEETAKGNIPPEVLRWARGLAEGKTIAEMAVEDKVSPSKIKMALKRAREKLGPLWEEKMKIGAGIIVAVMLVLFFPRRGPHPDARYDDQGMATQSATPRATEVVPEASTYTTDELFGLARDRCNVRDWYGCRWALDQAAQQDPDFDRRPDVIALRQKLDAVDRAPPMRLKP